MIGQTAPARAQALGSNATVIGPTAEQTSASLLPEPASGGLDGTQDAMSMMYELVAKAGQTSASTGEIGVAAQNKQQQADAQREATALKQEEADEAKQDTGGGLFGAICHLVDDVTGDLTHARLTDVATDALNDTVDDAPHLMAQLEAIAPQVAEYVGVAAAVVGAAALTTASCGAAGVAVAAVVIALSAGGMAAAKTHLLGKYSAEIGLGMEIGGSVLSFGASSAMTVDTAAQTAAAVVDGASGATNVVAGAAGIVAGNQQADVVDDTADVQQAMQAMNRSARLVADLVAGLKCAQQSNTNALQVLAGAAQTYGQTLTLSSSTKA